VATDHAIQMHEDVATVTVTTYI